MQRRTTKTSTGKRRNRIELYQPVILRHRRYGAGINELHPDLKNLIDEAILNHGDPNEALQVDKKFYKIEELPFDFRRRRTSVILENDQQQLILAGCWCVTSS
jgi:magnesium-transporting ATPase (P-type)